MNTPQRSGFWVTVLESTPLQVLVMKISRIAHLATLLCGVSSHAFAQECFHVWIHGAQFSNWANATLPEGSPLQSLIARCNSPPPVGPNQDWMHCDFAFDFATAVEKAAACAPTAGDVAASPPTLPPLSPAVIRYAFLHRHGLLPGQHQVDCSLPENRNTPDCRNYCEYWLSVDPNYPGCVPSSYYCSLSSHRDTPECQKLNAPPVITALPVTPIGSPPPNPCHPATPPIATPLLPALPPPPNPCQPPVVVAVLPPIQLGQPLQPGPPQPNPCHPPTPRVATPLPPILVNPMPPAHVNLAPQTPHVPPNPCHPATPRVATPLPPILVNPMPPAHVNLAPQTPHVPPNPCHPVTPRVATPLPPILVNPMPPAHVNLAPQTPHVPPNPCHPVTPSTGGAKIAPPTFPRAELSIAPMPRRTMRPDLEFGTAAASAWGVAGTLASPTLPGAELAIAPIP